MYRRCTSAVWVVAVACALALTGPADVAAQTSAKKKQRVVKSADAVPSNYRALITRYFASKDGVGAKALSAQISRPGTWESPLGLGAAAPIVCVKWKVL